MPSPDVVANVQAGKTNTQTIGVTENKSNQITVEKEAKVETVDQSATETKVEGDEVVVIQNKVDPLYFSLFAFLFILWSYLLWKLPSPDQIWKK